MEYTEPLTVPFFLGTKTGELTLSNMVNIMLLISEKQLDQIGAGMSALAEHGAGWVITQYHIDITRMPNVDEPLIIGTQATSYNKLMTYRDYWIEDQSGQRIVMMHGAWVMMDLTKRKIIPIITSFPEKVGAAFDTKVERFPRLTKRTEFDQTLTYRVRYFDIDRNGHVNNAHYMDWLEDALGADFLTTHQPQSVDIKYAREATYGTTVDAAVTVEGETSYHQISTDGVVNAEAKLTWRAR
ncbi:acyl-[acyl-carrier-protein] thioesterase [Lacticaseibacillus salsurivasis]|uniref:acyl-[acyl-carrier-protein] thioesterase n=1 Tax=Lacticaseibacillus salsurivasis TaxID=3081441 RepID=UPI0030C723C3